MKQMQHFFPLLNIVLTVKTCMSFDGTSLAGGTFQARVNVDGQADIAHDIRDMQEALSQSEFDVARNIYEAGKNSKMYDDDGHLLPGLRTLSSLSLNQKQEKYLRNPTYDFQLFGLGGMDTQVARQHAHYADEFVKNALSDERSGTLASEAAVALNLWMYAAHKIWQTVVTCSDAQYYSSHPSEAFGFKEEKISLAFNEAIAYWVGSDQEPGTKNGFALYSLAQRGGHLFDTNIIGTESGPNKGIRGLFEKGFEFLSQENACSKGRDTLKNMWAVANQMISKMTIPLMQMLIHSMKEEDQARVKLYALAVVPQISACRKTDYDFLKELLLERTYNSQYFDDILFKLQSSYDCLGFSCQDIGAYKINVLPTCASRPALLPMAGYSPSSDVYQHSKIDLDIVQIRILSLMKNYPMASNIYNFGRNSLKEGLEYRNIKYFATAPELENVKPLFKQFQSYYQKRNYADVVVQETLEGHGKWEVGSTMQRTATIVGTIQHQILPMYILSKMDSAANCGAGTMSDNIKRINSWDEGAAYMIGSLEGMTEGGADLDDGQLLWNLANRRCSEFNTCTENGYATVNSEMEDLLFAGKGELNSGDCTNIASTVRNIEHLMFVPIIQSILRYALINEKVGRGSPDASIAEADALSRSVLPIIKHYQPEGAEALEKNMVFHPYNWKPVEDGSQKVGMSLFPIMEHLELGCEFVGSKEGVDTCMGLSSASISKQPLIMASSMFFALVIYLL